MPTKFHKLGLYITPLSHDSFVPPTHTQSLNIEEETYGHQALKKISVKSLADH